MGAKLAGNDGKTLREILLQHWEPGGDIGFGEWVEFLRWKGYEFKDSTLSVTLAAVRKEKGCSRVTEDQRQSLAKRKRAQWAAKKRQPQRKKSARRKARQTG